MKKLIIIIFSLLAPTALVQSMEQNTIEKHVKFLANQKPASNFEHLVNKHLGQYISLPISSLDASNDTKIRWSNIQDELTIPTEYHLPIKHFSESSIFSHANIAGLCTPNNMYLSSTFSDLPMGLQQFVLYHEGMHHKYLDAPKGNLLFAGTIFSSFFASKKISNMLVCGKRWYITALRLMSSYGLGLKLSSTFTKHIEHRADVDAAHTLKCHVCLDEYTQFLTKFNEEERVKNGYLSLEEFKAIAKEQKRANNVCAKHKI